MNHARPRARPGAFLLLRRLRAPLVVLITVYTAAIIGLTLVPGNPVDGRPAHMGLFHAFYFVSFLGTTIGLGEIPAPFSDAQRLWASFSIYATVIAWLYGIGELLATLQDPLYRRIRHEARFRREVARVAEPYVVVCGYGDAGALVTRELTEGGIGVVVIDTDQPRVDAVEVDELYMNVPALNAAATEPRSLLAAGVERAHCLAVLALTGDDSANLAIALNARLLAPRARTLCVAHHHERQAAMASIHAGHIINPHDTFAERLAMAIEKPGLHVIYEVLTTQAGTPSMPVTRFPAGRWIVCGHGRFGRTVRRHLLAIGIQVRVVCDPGYADEPADPAFVTGELHDAGVLRRAGVEDADGLVVAIADDTRALALTLLARELNPRLFTVVRQSERSNTPLFRALHPDIATLSGYIVAAEVLRIIRAPQLSYFLRLARHQDAAWADALLARMREQIGNEVVDSWSLEIGSASTPTVNERLRSGRAVRLGKLLRAPDNRDLHVAAVALLLQRGDTKLLLPAPETPLCEGDRLLLCGQPAARGRLRWTLHDSKVLDYLCQPDDTAHACGAMEESPHA
jgi:Trk K+ transport system NAD-binding subunit